MCGILGEFNTTIKKKGKKKDIEIKAESANEFIVNQYQDQVNRGQKGFGIIRIDPKGKFEVDRATEGTKFLLDLYLKKSNMIIAHHRTPTSTENKIDQTHPMFISNRMLKYDYYLIHNGMITNDGKLKEKHEKLGFKYKTECTEKSQYCQYKTKWNDSEALAVEIALFIEGKEKAVEIDNAAAFLCLQVNKETNTGEQVFFGRNKVSSALNMSKIAGKLRISSEGAGEEVKENILYSFKIKDPKMELNRKEMPFEEKKEPIKPIISTYTQNQTSAPATMPLLPTTQKVSDEKKEDETIQTITQRKWEKIEEEIDWEKHLFIEKDYKENICATWKEDLKEEEQTITLSHVIDDKLDEEIEKITELTQNFKEIILVNEIGDKTRGFYLSQIAQIMKTMELMTDMAETRYQELKIAEDAQEIEDYNIGFQAPAGRGFSHRKQREKDELEAMGF